MSTRMMLVIQENKELNVVSYGHCDAYPTSAGMDIFKTLKSIDIDDFKEKCKKCLKIAKFKLSKLSNLNEYMDKLKKH